MPALKDNEIYRINRYQYPTLPNRDSWVGRRQ